MSKLSLLYITFIDPNNIGNSGSAVRPLRMLQAFQKLNLDIKVVYGTNAFNARSIRKKNVREAIEWVKNNHVDACYVEPPSGPMFCKEDHILLKTLHSKGVPIALFYRDCYWMFPETYGESGASTFKQSLIRMLCKRDLKFFYEVCNKIYYPSETMAELIPQHTDWDALPPGAEELDLQLEYAEDIKRIERNEKINFFFIGGATKRYGIDILLNSMRILNKAGTKAYLTLVCPEEQWNSYEDRKRVNGVEWLNVYHLRPGKELEELYSKADVCVIPQKKELYSDFAVNVKLFEYLAHRKPVLTSNCFEVSKVIDKYNIGWIVKDDPLSMSEQMQEIVENPDTILPKKSNCEKALVENTWEARAKKVIKDLLEYRENKNGI